MEKETRAAEEKRRRLHEETLHCLGLQLKDKQDSTLKEQQLARQYSQEVPPLTLTLTYHLLPLFWI